MDREAAMTVKALAKLDARDKVKARGVLPKATLTENQVLQMVVDADTRDGSISDLGTALLVGFFSLARHGSVKKWLWANCKFFQDDEKSLTSAEIVVDGVQEKGKQAGKAIVFTVKDPYTVRRLHHLHEKAKKVDEDPVTGLLFPDYSEDATNRFMRKVATFHKWNINGGEVFTFHALRGSGAIHLERLGADAMAIAAQGHWAKSLVTLKNSYLPRPGNVAETSRPSTLLEPPRAAAAAEGPNVTPVPAGSGPSTSVSPGTGTGSLPDSSLLDVPGPVPSAAVQPGVPTPPVVQGADQERAVGVPPPVQPQAGGGATDGLPLVRAVDRVPVLISVSCGPDEPLFNLVEKEGDGPTTLAGGGAVPPKVRVEVVQDAGHTAGVALCVGKHERSGEPKEGAGACPPSLDHDKRAPLSERERTSMLQAVAARPGVATSSRTSRFGVMPK